jgi:hypothetical protein
MKKMSFVLAILVSAALAGCHSKKANTAGTGSAGSGDMGSGSAMGSGDMGSGSAAGGGSGSAM